MPMPRKTVPSANTKIAGTNADKITPGSDVTSGTDLRPSRSIEKCLQLYVYGALRSSLQKTSAISSLKRQTPREAGRMRSGESGDDLLSRAESLLSLALGRFTVLFGMGRGGTAPLWSPDITVGFPGLTRKAELGLRLAQWIRRWIAESGLKLKRKKKFVLKLGLIALEGIQGYRVKPYGQLVLVSLTHYCASTPSLSTLWSSTTLQGAQGPGEISS